MYTDKYSSSFISVVLKQDTGDPWRLHYSYRICPLVYDLVNYYDMKIASLRSSNFMVNLGSKKWRLSAIVNEYLNRTSGKEKIYVVCVALIVPASVWPTLIYSANTIDRDEEIQLINENTNAMLTYLKNCIV